MSQEIIDLLTRMLVVNPKARMSLPEIYDHPWVRASKYDPKLVEAVKLRTQMRAKMKSCSKVQQILCEDDCEMLPHPEGLENFTPFFESMNDTLKEMKSKDAGGATASA